MSFWQAFKMTRRFSSTRKFDKQLLTLDKITRKQAIKAIELFMKDPAHPSPRLKKVKGLSELFSESPFAFFS